MIRHPSFLVRRQASVISLHQTCHSIILSPVTSIHPPPPLVIPITTVPCSSVSRCLLTLLSSSSRILRASSSDGRLWVPPGPLGVTVAGAGRTEGTRPASARKSGKGTGSRSSGSRGMVLGVVLYGHVTQRRRHGYTMRTRQNSRRKTHEISNDDFHHNRTAKL